MATGNHINNFTAVDIERYHKGQLSPAEMHAMEKAALEDPFLADALEGYATHPNVNVASDINDLQRRLDERTGEQARIIPIGKAGKSKFPFLRVAAMLLVLIVSGYFITRLVFNKKEESIALVEPGKASPVPGLKDSTSQELTSITADSGKGSATLKNNSINTETSRKKLNTGNTNDKQDVETPASPVSKNGETNNPVRVQDDVVVHQSEVVAPAAPEKHVLKAKDEDAKKAAEIAGNNRDLAAKKADTRQRAQAMNTFRGRVTDESNNGVPFANVTTIQDNVGTYADASGYFNFRSPDTVLDVQVRSIGFENNISRLNRSAQTNRVVLEEDRSLNELVISNSRPNTEARSRRSNVTLEEPEPADGWRNYDAYLANNLNVPDDYKTKPDPNPSVEVSFEVDTNGEPINIRIERSLCQKCDSEAIRLIKEGPKWKRNANSRGRTTVTINF